MTFGYIAIENDTILSETHHELMLPNGVEFFEVIQDVDQVRFYYRFQENSPLNQTTSDGQEFMRKYVISTVSDMKVYPMGLSNYIGFATFSKETPRHKFFFYRLA